MRKLPLLLLFSLLYMAMLPIHAAPLRILPFVVGSFSQIKQQQQDKPFIVVFWSETCSYCMTEMAMLAKYQKQYPEVTLITVATDVFLEDEVVQKVLHQSQLDLQQTWVFAEQFPEVIYVDVNKRWRGELPVTHFFDRDHQEIRHMGIIKEDELRAWLSAQSPLKSID